VGRREAWTLQKRRAFKKVSPESAQKRRRIEEALVKTMLQNQTPFHKGRALGCKLRKKKEGGVF